MALTLSNTGIAVSQSILAAQISQSIDAFTNTAAYDISLSGSLKVTGSLIFSSSDGFIKAPGLSEQNVSNVLVYQTSTGNIFYTGSTGLLSPSPISPYITGSGCDIKPIKGSNRTFGCNFSSIGGGQNNNITSSCSYIGGGQNNLIQGAHSSIVGGKCNSIATPNSASYPDAADCSFIGGGLCNTICSTGGMKNAYGASIVGGLLNTNSAYYSTIGGGNRNTISDYTSNAFIGAGTCNNISQSADNGFIGSGTQNEIICSAYGSAIITGCCNRICGRCSTILGGFRNDINSSHNNSHIIGSCISSSAACTVHVNNLISECTIQLKARDPLPTGAAGQLIMSGSGGVCRLYFHNGSAFKEVCLIP